jgi:hypothetical protein
MNRVEGRQVLDCASPLYRFGPFQHPPKAAEGCRSPRRCRVAMRPAYYQNRLRNRFVCVGSCFMRMRQTSSSGLTTRMLAGRRSAHWLTGA